MREWEVERAVCGQSTVSVVSLGKKKSQKKHPVKVVWGVKGERSSKRRMKGEREE
jgi:hypothetical protein